MALDRLPAGKVRSAELERERGLLVWSFDFATPGTDVITEVLVSAVTGQVLDVDTETPLDEARESSERP